MVNRKYNNNLKYKDMKKVVNTESEQAKDYYRGQLNKLVASQYGFSIKIVSCGSGGNDTNYMNINNDSIEVIVEHLNSLKK